MTEQFNEGDEKVTDIEDDLVEEKIVEPEERAVVARSRAVLDARRRLEDLMEEKRLRRELDDFP
jgi:hypothetical protein